MFNVKSVHVHMFKQFKIVLIPEAVFLSICFTNNVYDLELCIVTFSVTMEFLTTVHLLASWLTSNSVYEHLSDFDLHNLTQ